MSSPAQLPPNLNTATGPVFLLPIGENEWRRIVFELVDTIARQYGPAVALRVVAGLEAKYRAAEERV